MTLTLKPLKAQLGTFAKSLTKDLTNDLMVQVDKRISASEERIFQELDTRFYLAAEDADPKIDALARSVQTGVETVNTSMRHMESRLMVALDAKIEEIDLRAKVLTLDKQVTHLEAPTRPSPNQH